MIFVTLKTLLRTLHVYTLRRMNSILYFACHKNTTSVILYYYDMYRRTAAGRPPPAIHATIIGGRQSKATKARRK